jgi:hypothetical protein
VCGWLVGAVACSGGALLTEGRQWSGRSPAAARQVQRAVSTRCSGPDLNCKVLISYWGAGGSLTLRTSRLAQARWGLFGTRGRSSGVFACLLGA